MRRVVFNQKGGVGQVHDHQQPGGDCRGRRASACWSSTWTARATPLDTCWGEAADEGHAGSAAFFAETLKFSVRETDAMAFIVESPWENLHVMPASAELDELHGKLESRYKIYKLRKALELLTTTTTRSGSTRRRR